MRIYESTITNKGLDYIKSLDEFEIWGNHYFPYPKVLDNLSKDYEINTEYHGNCEQGSAITTFRKKPAILQRADYIAEMLKNVENNLKIRILQWEFEEDMKPSPHDSE